MHVSKLFSLLVLVMVGCVAGCKTDTQSGGGQGGGGGEDPWGAGGSGAGQGQGGAGQGGAGPTSSSSSGSPSSSSSSTGSSGGNGDLADLCVNTINQYRATLGLPPYKRWVEAEMCSDEEAKSDSISMQPHGAFGQCGESAQNECPGWPGAPESIIGPCLEMMWAEGPGADFEKHGHYINMSSTNYTEVACGFWVTTEGEVWAVQNFR
jgi:hypothetical protein